MPARIIKLTRTDATFMATILKGAILDIVSVNALECKTPNGSQGQAERPVELRTDA